MKSASASEHGWEWDESLFAGSAPYYSRGRLPYAANLPEVLEQALDLDGSGRLLDVDCGPGTVVLPLAPLFEAAVGVDPDAGMLAEARRRGEQAGVRNVRWVRARAEELPAGLGTFRVAVFAQSFHWMDQAQVAGTVRRMLDPDGAFVHISDAKEPLPPDGLPHPLPPAHGIRELVRRHLGPVRRAGQGVLPHGTPGGEAAVLAQAGFAGPERLRVPVDLALERTVDDVVAFVYSRSDSAPHLFGPGLAEFDGELRSLLTEASDDGRFSERVPDTEVFVWRPSRP
ncbi:class I SAM-dependent methyltransferase [Micromonospora inyonensis]|uniref:Methyltransferase domain-containing protein n=1 Tax=Micromonospora inyonensis TaxID=47866 RepID=A0A1C6R999_9ACTN|nr:class I SAM-dependent methyltransferase [Micromonospora inyonensis]SCL13571.1 Methyltransferase domain-containing protein [Micromonospora inyonensis]